MLCEVSSDVSAVYRVPAYQFRCMEADQRGRGQQCDAGNHGWTRSRYVRLVCDVIAGWRWGREVVVARWERGCWCTDVVTYSVLLDTCVDWCCVRGPALLD